MVREDKTVEAILDSIQDRLQKLAHMVRLQRENPLTPPRSVYEDENNKLSCLRKFPTIKSNPSFPKPIVCAMPNRPEKFFYTEKIFTESEFEEFENPWGDYESKEDDVPDHDNEPGETGPDDGECLVDFNVFDNIRFDEEPEVEESNKPEAEGKTISFIGDGTTITLLPLLPTNSVEHQTMSSSTLLQFELHVFKTSKEPKSAVYDEEPIQPVQMNAKPNSHEMVREDKKVVEILDSIQDRLQKLALTVRLQRDNHLTPPRSVYEDENHKLSCLGKFPTIKSNPSFPKLIVCAMPNRLERFFYTEKIFTESEFEEFENPWGDYKSKEDDVPDHDNEPGETGPDDGECLVDFNVFDNIRFDEEPEVEESNKPEAEGKTISFIGDGTTITLLPLLPTHSVEHQTIAETDPFRLIVFHLIHPPRYPTKHNPDLPAILTGMEPNSHEMVQEDKKVEEILDSIQDRLQKLALMVRLQRDNHLTPPRSVYENETTSCPVLASFLQSNLTLLFPNLFLPFDPPPRYPTKHNPDLPAILTGKEPNSQEMVREDKIVEEILDSIQDRLQKLALMVRLQRNNHLTPPRSVYEDERKKLSCLGKFPTIKSNPSFPKPIVSAMPNRPEKLFYTEKIFTESEFEEFENPWGDYESKEYDMPDHDNEPGETGPDDDKCLVDFNVFANIRFDEEPEVEESNEPETKSKTISFIGDGTTITLLPLLPTNSVEHQTMSFSTLLQFELHVFKTSKEPKSAVYEEEPFQPLQMNAKCGEKQISIRSCNYPGLRSNPCPLLKTRVCGGIFFTSFFRNRIQNDRQWLGSGTVIGDQFPLSVEAEP
ncbi:hypothetical protein L1987_27746 [Smallanthus sonchifolius]|uniref:Uncharacterized protein n=1 Tax=Smallanthus sonchifolius TaxID=185202 RepID=A0ACB9IC43_9ASTR|nr:hypothetical protein L1987_27746 [Smallanthus sonchifolius]